MSSGFVSEADIAEERKRRQEEWEKVRTSDQPVERPEEPYDSRSLFDRLKEQKMKKDLEYEEAHKLKNLIRGLDDDEVQFLEMVDQNKIDAEKQQAREVEQEIKDFRNRVATLQEETVDKKIQLELKSVKSKDIKAISGSSRPSQKSLLSAGIKRKNGETNKPIGNEKVVKTGENEKPPLNRIMTKEFDKGNLKCVAILPGIGPYGESSDSELSSGSDDEPETNSKYDLVGRKRQKKKICQDD